MYEQMKRILFDEKGSRLIALKNEAGKKSNSSGYMLRFGETRYILYCLLLSSELSIEVQHF